MIFFKFFTVLYLRAPLMIGVAAIVAGLASPGLIEDSADAKEKSFSRPVVDLPAAHITSPTALEETLHKRRSVRHFSEKPLSLKDLGQLLWAAQGITHSRGFRTSPSAGALYPLEIYAVVGNAAKVQAGIYHYRPAAHEIKPIKMGNYCQALCQAGLSQPAICNAPISIVMSGIFERTTSKYRQRGFQYVFMEAGHSAQNVLLQAVSLHLGAVPVGAFDNQAVSRLLDLPASETPLYILCVGHPADH